MSVREIASPFALPDDPEAQKNALTTALTLARGFALYFVVCDPGPQRQHLMDEIANRLSDKRMQCVAVTKETQNLLHLLENVLYAPLPDAIFVYGLENRISGAVDPRSIPFLLNLNATRNNFILQIPCPLIFFASRYVMTALINGAPDFFSVRSGSYIFPLSDEERKEKSDAIAKLGQTEILGFPYAKRDERIAEMQHLLAEYRSLPKTKRNPLDEARLMNQIALAYYSLGQYTEAEPLYKELLEIRRVALPEVHLDIARSLNNLANLYRNQGRYSEAEPMLLQALEMLRSALPAGHPDITQSLNNLAILYQDQGRYSEAEQLYRESLEMLRSALPTGYRDIASNLNSLAVLYRNQGRYTEAESLYRESLRIRRSILPAGHPYIAQSLNNLAILYRNQSRYSEAEPLYKEAAQIMQSSLGDEHPHTQIVMNNLKDFQQEQAARDGQP